MSARTMRSRRRKIERRAMRRKEATLTREDLNRAYALALAGVMDRRVKGWMEAALTPITGNLVTYGHATYYMDVGGRLYVVTP